MALLVASVPASWLCVPVHATHRSSWMKSPAILEDRVFLRLATCTRHRSPLGIKGASANGRWPSWPPAPGLLSATARVRLAC
jgi:hypothetical protein